MRNKSWQSLLCQLLWILLLKGAVTSAEGTNTMSQECFVKLIESQLKVFVQRRIARDMLVADMMSGARGGLT
jgi:hypothetical protein